MARWVKMKNGLIGMIVCELKLHAGKAYGLDLTGEGDIYYVPVKETSPHSLPK